MPYREVALGKEIFVTRVSEEAIEEWKEARERNRYSGYPDRPPDVDTSLHRGWIAHPNEKDKFTHLLGDRPKEVFPVYSICCIKSFSHLGIEIEGKLLISCFPELDQYEFRHIARMLNGTTIGDVSFTASSEEFEGVFQKELESYSRAFIEKESIPFISTYHDYEEMYAETELAEKELKEYYGNTQPKLVN